MDRETTEKIRGIFANEPAVGVAYLFGSQARHTTGPLSDYDFAVYIDEKNAQKRFDVRLKMLGKLTRALKTDDVDLVVLNDVNGPELKYDIMKEGILLLEREPYKVLIEPQIWNEYFDFHQSLVQFGLTKVK